MSGRAFLDTNIFVYNFDASATAGKRSVASQLIQDGLERGRCVISYQVIQEFLNVARSKFAVPLSVPDLQVVVRSILKPLLVVLPSPDLFCGALDIHVRYQISWYDSLIVAAAAEAGCSVLYTEDLQHGARLNGVTIENPFRK